MSTPDYDIHLDRSQFDSLWDLESHTPFPEDMEEIEQAIAEELSQAKSRRKRRRRS